SHSVSWASVGLSAFVIFCLSFLAIKSLPRSPGMAIGWFWFLGMLVPVIGLIHVGDQSMADRYSYLPSIGFFLAGTSGLYNGLNCFGRYKSIVLTMGALGCLLGCLAGTWHQVTYWRNSESLWQHTLAIDPQNDLAHLN